MAKQKRYDANNPTGPRRVTSLLRESEALRLRSLRMPYSAIGRRLKVDGSTAHRLVARGLERLKMECNELAETVREIDLLGLDEMQSRLVEKIEAGDCEAIRTAIKCQERRAKLLGLDAPTKTEGKSANGSTDVMLLTRQQMEAALRASRDRLQAQAQKARGE